jgi:hypothetical protein
MKRWLTAIVVALFVALAATGPARAQELTPPPSSGNRIPTGGGTATETETATATATATETATETATATETETETATATETETDADSLATVLSAPLPAGQRRASHEEEAPGEETEAEEPWDGPAIELGYTHYSLADGFGGGAVHAGTFGGYLPTGPIRIGLVAEVGVRQYALSDDDLLLRGTLIAGYQHLGWLPFAPFAAATATAGGVFGQRFSTTQSWGLGGGGVEVGADLVITRSLWAGLSLGYQRVSMGGSGFDLLILRVRAGL